MLRRFSVPSSLSLLPFLPWISISNSFLLPFSFVPLNDYLQERNAFATNHYQGLISLSLDQEMERNHHLACHTSIFHPLIPSFLPAVMSFWYNNIANPNLALETSNPPLPQYFLLLLIFPSYTLFFLKQLLFLAKPWCSDFSRDLSLKMFLDGC